jgi:uncharacterized membrane protein
MPVLGIVLGFIVGVIALDGIRGGLAGALVGFIVALAIRSQSQAIERKAQARRALDDAVPPPAGIAPPSSLPHRSSPAALEGDAGGIVRTMLERLDAIDHRLDRLEAGLAQSAPDVARSPRPPVAGLPASEISFGATPASDTLAGPPAAIEHAGALPPARISVAPASSALPDALAPITSSASAPSAPSPSTAAPTAPAAGAGTPLAASAPAGSSAGASIVAPRDATVVVPPSPLAQATRGAPVPSPVMAPNALYAWFTGGNTLTRVGVVVLFFGVGFLLKHFAQYLTIPIELRLAGVALAGAGLLALGIALARRRPGYGVSLQGAGAGVLYLTTFAAFRYYDVLPDGAALALLPAIAALTVWLAIRSDSQPLAGLAVAGGFLAPFLVGARAGEPALLFGYFAVLNVAILAVASIRAWRALNALGFVFTFALGLFWGRQYYQPEYFPTVQPFLALFFAFYVAIAVLHARQVGSATRLPVDALLVFGVPLVGFALQASLVRDVPHGAAWSAAALAAVYGVLHAVLRGRAGAGLVLLARAFLVLAIIFATLAIPFAADPHWTSAWWALEAAAVYWIGCEQRQGVVRAFAIVLQLAAGVAFALGGMPEGEHAFLNASFLGAMLIAIAGLATAFLADRRLEHIAPFERKVISLLFAWGAAWWVGAGALEAARNVQQGDEANATLAWITGSVAVALWLRRPLAWPRLAWFGAALLPAMAMVAFRDWHHARTTLQAYGWLVWPVAWITHWRALRGAEPSSAGAAPDASDLRSAGGILHHVHSLSAIALVVWISWEASEWVGRAMPLRTAWMACAAAWPAIAFLALMTRAADAERWPLARYRSAYAVSAGTAIAALLGFWFCAVNVMSPGTATPLPFVPLANPLDVTLLAALAALFAWMRRYARPAEPALYAWFGAALFLFVNAGVFRTVHQWSDLPWRWSALVASKPLQAALTLAWTAAALPLMVAAGRRGIRPLWMVGTALLAIVVAKLFLVDLSALSGLPRIVAFLGVGALLLVIGYVAPLPPALPPDGGASGR